MSAIREGRWLCPYCGAENLGRFESCEGHGNSGCGAARGQVRFYLPENSPIVTDPDSLADANSGQDWVCDHCDGANKNAYQGHVITNCVHCGEARTEKDQTVEKRHYTTAAVPRTHEEATPKRPSRAQLAQERQRSVERRQEAPPRQAAKVFVGAAIVLVLALAAFAAWFFFFDTTETPLRVADKTWERVLVVETVETRHDEGWDYPANATILSSDWRFKETIEVFSHYEERTRMVSQEVPDGTYVCGQTDLGNGYFQDRECPKTKTIQVPESYDHPIMKDEDVYADWYQYIYPYWRETDRLITRGHFDTPAWANPRINSGQRTRQVSETYTIVLDTPDGPHSRSLNETAWTSLQENTPVIGHYNRMGSLMSIDLP